MPFPGGAAPPPSWLTCPRIWLGSLAFGGPWAVTGPWVAPGHPGKAGLSSSCPDSQDLHVGPMASAQLLTVSLEVHEAAQPLLNDAGTCLDGSCPCKSHHP